MLRDTTGYADRTTDGQTDGRTDKVIPCSLTSDTPVTLKQAQGHKIYHENGDPKQGYNHAKFETWCFNGV